MTSFQSIVTFTTIYLAAALPLQEVSLERRADCSDLGSLISTLVQDITSIASAGVNLGESITSLVEDSVNGDAIASDIENIVDSSLGIASGVVNTVVALPFECLSSLSATKRDDTRAEAKKLADAIEDGIHGGTVLAQSLISLQNSVGENNADDNIKQIDTKCKYLVGSVLNGTKTATDQWPALSRSYGGDVGELENFFSQLW